MISRLSGKLIEKLPTSIIIETGGVGFEVLISSRTYEKLPNTGNDVSLNIYTHLREEEIRLIGFLNNDEKDLFLKLIGVSGISVKIALSSLSIYSVEELKRIIVKREIDLIRRIPGVGKKLAERMIVELKDKLEEFDLADVYKGVFIENERITEVKQALRALGYSNQEIIEVMRKIKIEDILDKKVEEVLKIVLRQM
jgi:Holliday junction DNA helicase RuvA